MLIKRYSWPFNLNCYFNYATPHSGGNTICVSAVIEKVRNGINFEMVDS